MKKSSALFLCLLLLAVVFSCKKDDEPEDLSVPSISNLSRDISSPEPGQTVVISATVTASEASPLTSVALKWSVNNVSQTNISMSNSGDVYSATIPAQNEDGAVVNYTVAAANKNGVTEESGSYVVTLVPVDYTKLKLNEVSGVGDDSEKFYELINTGSKMIPLEGCKIYYNANGSVGQSFPPEDNRLTWTGIETQFIQPGELFSLIGRNNEGSFTTGLTAQRILIITLEDPDGNVIDKCIRAEDTGDYAITDKSYSRIPDGTGPFYFTTPTPDAMNGSSSGGLLLVPETHETVTPPEDDDYTHLILNEISGEQKFVEIYNAGAEPISLNGVKLERNDGASSWIGTEDDEIPAGAYRIFLFNSFAEGLDSNPAYTGWTVSSGISDQQILKIALVAPSGTPIEVFIRGEEPLDDWGTAGAERERDYSYSRMNDDSWAYAVHSPGAENGNKEKEIVNPGYLTE